jgi:type IV secretory pathway VirD2 relaxase
LAVDHYNTDHPHSHIVIRGKGEDGKDLIMAKDYITHGIRARAGEWLTLELRPEDQLLQNQKLNAPIDPQRIDRSQSTLYLTAVGVPTLS